MRNVDMIPVRPRNMFSIRKLLLRIPLLVAVSATPALTPASTLNGNATAGNQGFLVVADQTTLTVALEDADLHEVLKIIADQAGFIIEIIGKNRQRKLTEQFDDVPIAEGLDQLLRDVNYAIVYSNTESPRRIERIFLFSDKKTAPGDRPVATREAPAAGTTQGKVSPLRIPTPEQIVIDPNSGRTLKDELKSASEAKSRMILPELLRLESAPVSNPAKQPPQSIESLIQSGTFALPKEIEHLLRGEQH